MECIKGTVCKEVDKLDKDLRPNVCMVVSPLTFTPRTICFLILLGKIMKKLSCKESIIPLGNTAFQIVAILSQKRLTITGKNKRLSLIRKQNTLCYNLWPMLSNSFFFISLNTEFPSPTTEFRKFIKF